jgi:hypothetical protein
MNYSSAIPAGDSVAPETIFITFATYGIAYASGG